MIGAGDRSIELERIRSLEEQRISMGHQVDTLLADNLDLDRARLGWMEAALALDGLLEQERALHRRLEQAWRDELDALVRECARLRGELARGGGPR